MRLGLHSLVLCILLFASPLSSSQAVTPGIFNILDFGAAGDGQTYDTAAIQKAIDTCAVSGGGVVHFPMGRYLSGMIHLKSHVTLDLAPSAVLLGSTRLEDYPLTLCEFASYTDSYCGRALIWGENLEDVGITGAGTIDGQGEAFKDNRPTEAEAAEIARSWENTGRYRPRGVYINRPYIIRLISCNKVRIEGITLLNSPMWMQHYLNCDFVRIHRVSVYNHCTHNNDMIDIDCCRDVIVSDCFGDSDDDALTLKSNAGLPTENVTITNCVLSSHCNAIKMGTESSGGFKNITISNCVIRPSRDREALAGEDSGLAGIALEIVDGGTMDGVTITNTAISGQTTPVFIRLGNRARPYRKDLPKPGMGVLRNVVISNLVARDAGTMSCSITGLPGHPVENVILSNIQIGTMGGDPGTIPAEIPEQPEKYPESAMFGPLPAYGFYCRHVKGLTFRDVSVSSNQPDPRPAFVFDDVTDLALNRISTKVDPDAPAHMIIKDSSDVVISGCNPSSGQSFLSLQGGCNRINLAGNDLSQMSKPFLFDPPSLEKVLFSNGNRMLSPE